ncbi:cold-shock protein [Haloarcula sp. JP-L23]|uniref:cold-shock protein n=1 Tax=Haloarcula sp. JP-L23 TaxID=2716717 RepID=UPI00140EA4E7|nr:cold shock domain-containing protein [Haloarcula sp. JP-L23]
MPTGTVRFVHDEEGYGFIETEAREEDVFFHQSAIDPDLTEGEEVKFDVEQSDRGPRAANLRRV